jgi:hypothetical protein
MPVSARHETRALLRAHLSAASSYRHLTRHCPVCHQLLRLAMEPTARPSEGDGGSCAADSGATGLRPEEPGGGGESPPESDEDQSLPKT